MPGAWANGRSKLKKLALILVVALCLVASLGRTALAPHQTTPSPAPAGDRGISNPSKEATAPVCDAGKACLAYVEYDEFGRPYNRGQLLDTLGQARSAAESNGIVVVFVHGWHHDAAPGDANIASFREVLQRAVDIDRAYGVRPRPVLGIYVGWRGESIKGDHWYSWPFSQLTFWDRKNTAQNVGNGAVYELLVRLSLLRGANKGSRLVVIGHSFGGAIVYSALSHNLLEQIATDPPANSTGDGDKKKGGKRWDLAMLVNPAFEAMRLRPQFELARSQEYERAQAPHLVLITTQADWATGTAFPLGRAVSTLFDKYADDDNAGRALNNTAVGQYIPFVTHQAALSTDCRRGEDDQKIVAGAGAAAVAANKTFCFNDRKALIDQGAPLLLSRCDTDADCAQVAPNHHITRGPAGMGLTPERMPIMNIRTTADVMADHNDIWNPTMQGFLTQFVILSVHHPDQL